MSKKPIIVFEGIEGSGKSHHISIVSKYLKNNKIDFLKIREPGGNPNSERIRKQSEPQCENQLDQLRFLWKMVHPHSL